MPRLGRTASLALTAAVLLTTLSLAHGAMAQQARNPLGPKPEFAKIRPELPPSAAGTAWPRLDVGAIFCRTQDDLRRRGEYAAARGAGLSVPAGPAPDCQVIGSPTPVDVLDRPLPSATQVRLKPKQPKSGETGWTDAWLPEKAPR